MVRKLKSHFVAFFVNFYQINMSASWPTVPPSPPIRATCTTFLDVKNDVLAHITEPSNNDYDNDGSDNCDHNFGTFDDFGVKNYQKVYT